MKRYYWQKKNCLNFSNRKTTILTPECEKPHYIEFNIYYYSLTFFQRSMPSDHLATSARREHINQKLTGHFTLRGQKI